MRADRVDPTESAARERVLAERAADPAAPRRPPDPVGLLRLQATVGNGAVSRMLRPSPRKSGPVRSGPARSGHVVPVQRLEQPPGARTSGLPDAAPASAGPSGAAPVPGARSAAGTATEPLPATAAVPPAPAVPSLPSVNPPGAPAATPGPATSRPEQADPGPLTVPSPASGTPGGAAPTGPLGFLGGLVGLAPSAFGAGLVATTAAGLGALAAHQSELQEALPARPAPTGLAPGPAGAPGAGAEPPLPEPTVPDIPVPAVGGPDGGAADPAVADRWSAAGTSAIAGGAASVRVDRPDVAAAARPAVDAASLPSARLTAPEVAAPPVPGAAVRPAGAQAAVLDANGAGEVAGRVGALLAPASAASAAHSGAVAATRDDAHGRVAEVQADTLARQQAATRAADDQVGVLQEGWAAQRGAIVGEHSAAVREEAGQVRAEAAQTMAAADAQARARTAEADKEGGGGLWDRVKAAARGAASTVAGVAGSVVGAVRGILDAARARVAGALTRFAGAVRQRVAAAVAAVRAGARRVAQGIASAVAAARAAVTRLATAAVALARQVWQAATSRLAGLWASLTAAVRSALAAAGALARRLASALGSVTEILKLLASPMLRVVFEALRDPQGKVVAPIVAKAAPLAAQVPARAVEEAGKKQADDGRRSTPVQREAAPAPAGEGFWAGVWRHVKAAGAAFAANWVEVLAKVVLGILLWFPMIVEEGPKLWEECKGVVNGGGGLDRLDHVLGVLRHLVNIVAGTLATVGVWGMLFAWAGTPIAEAATVAAYEALSMQVLGVDIALSVAEMVKYWYSATEPGVASAVRDKYLELFSGSLISSVIMAVLMILGAIASRLAKAIKARNLASAAAEGAEGGSKAKVGADERPGGGGAEPSTGKRAALTPEEIKSGVRMARDLPDGGRLKLLADGTLVVCHSPCQAVATRFRRELNLPDAEAQGFTKRLAAIADDEKAAIEAKDVAGEEKAFDAADKLNSDLEAFRLKKMSAATAVPEATLKNLIRLAADDGELVQRLLGKVANNPDKVAELLTAARGDVNTLAKLARAVDEFPRTTTSPGSSVADPRFSPYATDANMPHFLERHSPDHFDFKQIKSQNTFLPPGTTPADIQEALVDAVNQAKRAGDQWSTATQAGKLRVFKIENGRLAGVTVQVTRDGGVFVQFFPLGGPGVVNFTREELTALGHFLGR